MHILIVETGIAPDPLANKFGRYPDMFEHLLGKTRAEFTFTACPVFQGAALPAPDSVDGVLITGSPAGVYDDLPWIAPLEEFIRSAMERKIPTIGVCFGHQLMVQALGGLVEKSGKGWGAGVHTYSVTDDAGYSALNGRQFLSCAVSHQDQVITLPRGAQRLAGSAFCPFGLLTFAQGPGLSMQMHPEFSPEFGSTLLKARLDRIPPDVADLALLTYRQPSDQLVLIELIAEFFENN